MKRTCVILSIVAAGVFAGCKDEKQNSGTQTQASQAAAPEAKDDHDHPGKGGDAGHHAGPKHDLGTQQVSGYAVAVKQVGDVKAGAGATFEITATGAGKPKAVRAWVGSESAEGSVKVKAEDREKFFDADLEVPATLSPDAKLWVEVETDAGKKVGSFELKK